MQQKQPSSSGKESEKKIITPKSIEEILTTEQQSMEEVSEPEEVQIIAAVSVSTPTVLDLTSPANLQ
jgi:hypothetical protein